SRIKKISGLYKGLKLFTTSVQNIDRMVSFYKAAASSGCSLVLDLYAAYVLWSLDKQTLPQASKDWEKVRVLFTDRYVSRLKSTRNDRMIASCENNKITQAEIKAKPGQFMLLYRQSSINDIEQIGDFKDSVLIYSMWDGYRREPSFQKTQNFLDKHGIALETAHTSGHASEADLGRLVKALQPKTLIPIHTQRPQDYQRLWPHVTRLDDGKEFVIP
ncbi:MAG: MBL fold metallo-hydrolase RNA specificity domain-containing protein, partial [Elusimicrobiota bacterium]